ncbi:MAG TPA: single-stranded-DNA-specific exonuclease RecJ, partial [Steroidobacteraceae bacterium]|nr:single-stranded-DNA-specific exonuclease RecJ [Steroidobacteraceae bacterium]
MNLRVVRRSAGGGEASTLHAGLHPVLRRIYLARGVRTAHDLDLSLERLLPVSTLESIAAAVDLLLAHRAAGRVLVIGDFDADGATSTALVMRALRAWGFAAVDFLVPNRFEFGYGLTPEIVTLAASRAPSLIITVDNGVSSAAGVARARAHGIDVLITDHHLPGAELPSANVIVNPNLTGSLFGSRSLAGVGVAFYVMAALKRRLDEACLTPPGAPGAAEFLDLVALGTVADLVPLDPNNRVLVAQGLRRIRAGRCAAGIRALLEIAGRSLEGLIAADLAFAVAPRLNAAGRLDDMSVGIRCLLADDAGTAEALARRLDELNQERRAIEGRMQVEALAAVRRLRDPGPRALERSGVCLFDESWHQGVVGLVASRIKEHIRRPVIAFAVAGEGQLRGSARSTPGIHIRDVLASLDVRHPQLIGRFGGHAMAAGLTLERSRLDFFARAFDEEVAAWAAQCGPSDAVETDGELALEEIALETAH